MNTPSDPRRIVEPDHLRSDISLCLQMAKGRASRDTAAREAFEVIARLIVDHLLERGYQVTAPPPPPPHSSSTMGLRQPGGSRPARDEQ